METLRGGGLSRLRYVVRGGRTPFNDIQFANRARAFSVVTYLRTTRSITSVRSYIAFRKIPASDEFVRRKEGYNAMRLRRYRYTRDYFRVVAPRIMWPVSRTVADSEKLSSKRTPDIKVSSDQRTVQSSAFANRFVRLGLRPSLPGFVYLCAFFYLRYRLLCAGQNNATWQKRDRRNSPVFHDAHERARMFLCISISGLLCSGGN